MTLPAHVSPANSFMTQRQKVNDLIDEVATLQYGNLQDIRFINDFAVDTGYITTTSNPAWPFTVLVGTGAASSVPDGMWYGIATSNKLSDNFSSNIVTPGYISIGGTAEWEFHTRFNVFWDPSSMVPSSNFTCQIGFGAKSFVYSSPMGIPNSMATNANNYYLQISVINGTLASVTLNGPSLSGTTDWSSQFSGYTGSITPGEFDRWDILSMKVLPGYQATFYLNGIALATATLPVNSRILNFILYKNAIGDGGSITHALNVDYFSVLTKDLRTFIPI